MSSSPHAEPVSGFHAAALRSWIERRLAATPVRNEPFRHLVVEDIFPEAFYDALLAHWPATALFKSDGKGRKYDLVPLQPEQTVDARAGGYAAMPASSRSLWRFFVRDVNRGIVGPALREMFRADIDARLAQLRSAHERGLIAYSMGRSDTWEPVANVGRFMMRGPGSELKPHVDAMPYVLTCLHYFPDQDVQGADGTVLYQADRPLDFDTCARSGSTEYFDRAGIDTREVMRVPFRRNMLLAFPNRLDASHGALPPEHGLRRLFQYHLSLKSDHEKV